LEERRREGRHLTPAMIAAALADRPAAKEPQGESRTYPVAPPAPDALPAASLPEPAVVTSFPEVEALIDEAAAVRPYLVTGGRTRTESAIIPIEALVEALRIPSGGLPTEQRRLLDLSAGQYLSVAELSAHLRLPVGVVRVVVGDLEALQLVRVHILEFTETDLNLPSLEVLESVLHGIATL
jgi:DNA-directed RNA polymerase specialized sigma24 family protein